MTTAVELGELKGLGPELARAAPVVADYLAGECPGREHARPKWACAAELRGRLPGLSIRQFEAICHALACATGDVGTSTRGYFWCLSDEDYAVAEAWLLPRFQPQRERYERVRRRRIECFGPPRLF